MATTAVLVLLAALLPALAAAGDRHYPAVDYRPVLTPTHKCGNQGRYAPGSAYDASLRLLAATIPAKANADSCNSSYGNIAGDSPDQVVASAYCSWHPDAKSSDCGACIALAFREAQRLCANHRQAKAVVDGGACTAYFHDYDLMEQYVHGGPSSHRSFWLETVLEFPDLLVLTLFQAAGLGCVVFLFIQEWRHRSRGPAIASNDYLPVTGDQ